MGLDKRVLKELRDDSCLPNSFIANHYEENRPSSALPIWLNHILSVMLLTTNVVLTNVVHVPEEFVSRIGSSEHGLPKRGRALMRHFRELREERVGEAEAQKWMSREGYEEETCG